jgi:hypothetical protein
VVALQQGEAALARIAQATRPNGTLQLGEVHPVRRPLPTTYHLGLKKMKPHDLKSMSVDELLSLHEFVSAALARKFQPKSQA